MNVSVLDFQMWSFSVSVQLSSIIDANRGIWELSFCDDPYRDLLDDFGDSKLNDAWGALRYEIHQLSICHLGVRAVEWLFAVDHSYRVINAEPVTPLRVGVFRIECSYHQICLILILKYSLLITPWNVID
jgi:hypothetical protein